MGEKKTYLDISSSMLSIYLLHSCCMVLIIYAFKWVEYIINMLQRVLLQGEENSYQVARPYFNKTLYDLSGKIDIIYIEIKLDE